MELDKIRREYKKRNLEESEVKPNPFDQFQLWIKEALGFVPLDPTAMTLSTVSSRGKPSSRIVLLKDFNKEGLTFFTNYESRKGQELSINPNASVLFYWKELERQIRIEGRIEKTSPETSDLYFEGRPLESRVAASVSDQSKIVGDRKKLDDAFNKLLAKQNISSVSRPRNWGGYILRPEYFEFWQGRENRMHDRVSYVLKNSVWEMKRLAP